MPYRMKEAAQMVGVSTRTLMRWFKDRKIEEVDRDRNNHRVFEERDIQRIKAYANHRVSAPSKLQPLLFEQEANS